VANTVRCVSVRGILKGKVRRGYCPICEGRTLFAEAGPWLRDHYYCARCLSVPRFRAHIRVLGEHFPNWRNLEIHESSPAGPSSAKIARECRRYVATRFPAGAVPGTVRDGFRCENLEHQIFADASFDLVVTQDVFEHVLDPAAGFAEIARTLRPGGAHVFTVPWYPDRPTRVRAHAENGSVVHDLPPEFHSDPIDPRGSLVVTEWGSDMLDFVRRCSGMTTTVESILDPRQGICGEFREVFVSRKPLG
jgi:hypothetical protein